MNTMALFKYIYIGSIISYFISLISQQILCLINALNMYNHIRYISFITSVLGIVLTLYFMLFNMYGRLTFSFVETILQPSVLTTNIFLICCWITLIVGVVTVCFQGLVYTHL